MRGKQKIFVVVGLLIIVLISASVYANYRLDHLVSSISQPGILFADTQDQQGDTSSGNVDVGPGVNNDTSSGNSSSVKGNTSSGTNGTGKNAIVSEVESKLNRPVDKTDMVKAGVIILRRLNSDEISYLYRVGSKNTISRDEVQQVQKILHEKLTPEDVATLKELGQKYGKDLSILDGV